jgi:cell division protein FtsI/penicillin-binding protein 2
MAGIPLHRRRIRCHLALGIAFVLALGALAGCSHGAHEEKPEAVAQEFATALTDGDAATLQRVVVAPDAAAAASQLTTVRHALGARSFAMTVGLLTKAKDGKSATAPLTTHVDAPPFAPFTLAGNLMLVQGKPGWQVAWTPQTLATELAPGLHYTRTTTKWPARAGIFGAGNAALTGQTATVTVGLEYSAVKDQKALTDALTSVGIDKSAIDAALAQGAQHTDWFIPITKMLEPDYLRVKSVIYPVPGTRFRKQGEDATATPGLSAHLIGHTGPITAELLAKLGAPYTKTSIVGLNGLELAQERQLAGTPGAVLRLVDARGKAVRTVATVAPKPGRAIHTTIELAVQRAAEAALANVTKPAALVAVRVSTGAVVATASVPAENGFDIALDGQFPPGSTFKIVTTAALLAHGLTPASTVHCPATITVDGRTFHNFEGEATPNLSLEDAFAQSCNAAFIGAAEPLAPGVIPAAAAQLGIGRTLDLGVEAYPGSAPAPKDPVDQVASAIGQGSVLVSPVVMANVAATVARGSYRDLSLVVGASGSRPSTPAPVALDPTVVDALRTMMAAVVARGTAAGAGLPAGTIGKTGTAEFGNANPPETHAWFVGVGGDLAFAVLVQGGGVGGRVAAPIASRFLSGLSPSS